MLTIAAISLNPTVGDIAGNLTKIAAFYCQAAAQKADLVIFTELAITGYPPEDLVLLPHFQQAATDAVKQLAHVTTGGPAMLVGGLLSNGNKKPYNVAFFLENGVHTHTIFKHHLPNHGVFDEVRTFTPGHVSSVIPFKGMRLGVLICEDLWHEDTASHPAQQQADMVISIHASPYDTHKQTMRRELIQHHASRSKLPMLYINQVGGQDELVFDGGSFSCYNNVIHQQPHWQEALMLWNWNPGQKTLSAASPTLDKKPAPEADIYHALMLGLTDYVTKNNFPGVILGMSGGIDSALVAALSVDALGKDRVKLVMMPSRHTSQASIDDATACARMLGVSLETLPIERLVNTYHLSLEHTLTEGNLPLMAENLQARIRGTLLMAISNAQGHLVFSTGNKSELSVGYATLYGDMCGGFNPLKDIYKTMVYRLCNWRNTAGQVIPEAIIHKAPSAELRPNQTDQDSLPPYDILDDVLYLLLEERRSTQDVLMLRPQYEAGMVASVASLIVRSEYKRHQAPPGVKITPLAFGRDRRIPITNRFKL